MSKIKVFSIGLLLVSNIFFIVTGHAITIPTASCSQSDVQAAINSSATGDTVVVPAGTCTWTGGVSISGRNITLKGSGTNVTIGYAGIAINIKTTSSRVTGFNFTLPAAYSNNSAIYVGAGTGWRIDNNTFTSQSTSSFRYAINVKGVKLQHPYGLIDQNTFTNCHLLLIGDEDCDVQMVSNDALDLGGSTAVYVEGNTFTSTLPSSTSDNSSDSICGGKLVYRFNTITDTYLELHSVQGSHPWGIRKWEIYNNQFNQVSRTGGSVAQIAWVRGGTGVIFNNIIGSGIYNKDVVYFDNVRSYEKRGSYFNICNGGDSPVDGTDTAISGTHTGGNGETALMDSSKSWGTNYFHSATAASFIGNSKNSGTTTAEDLTGITMTDSTATLIASGSMGEPYGMWLQNTTDGSGCTITGSMAHTLTCGGLTGGADNTWANGDGWAITNGVYIINDISGAKGQIRANTSNTITATLIGGTRQTWNNGDTYRIVSGYPCIGQVGLGSFPSQPSYPMVSGDAKQTPTPAYLWNNTHGAGTITVSVRSGITANFHIKPNRDYYDYNTFFDGKTGTGSGLLSARPVTCTPGVGYWATDVGGNWNASNGTVNDGALYKCTAPDTWTLYYTPYPYPHPLSRPAPPQNLKILK